MRTISGKEAGTRNSFRQLFWQKDYLCRSPCSQQPPSLLIHTVLCPLCSPLLIPKPHDTLANPLCQSVFWFGADCWQPLLQVKYQISHTCAHIHKYTCMHIYMHMHTHTHTPLNSKGKRITTNLDHNCSWRLHLAYKSFFF